MIYLIPYWEADSGYIVKNIKYKNEDFKRFNVIMCHCCGRNIDLTIDEYNDIIEEEEEDIIYHLEEIKHSIIKDIWKGKYEKIIDYTEEEYLDIRDKVFVHQEHLFLGRIELEYENGYEILIDQEEIEIIGTSDEEGILVDLTETDIEDMMDELED